MLTLSGLYSTQVPFYLLSLRQKEKKTPNRTLRLIYLTSQDVDDHNDKL